MFTILRQRSLLPIRATLAALAVGLGFPNAAVAATDQLYLDPTHVTCSIVSLRGGAKRCDVVYDGLTVHEGRETGEALANGDYVKCSSVVQRAKALGRDVMMLRGYCDRREVDWDNDAFFTVAGEGAYCR